ncbi:hypothetical protein L249_4653 [Ophiocordyceps polyrhachis-furcata BCC 54312]|uniref:VIT domain-containing protein n=1 Tax=Ophiocordyceps polyrhachis-furcata BCC 54312 TaxID=1330021 RepID=A0A367L2Z1_9HYPO|nr:hypothetical protein L249_4653 [Ophiocordyceps polyrhachis-furcata BCC 54312]
MSHRHLTKRLASGVLFSLPADPSTAIADIRPFKGKQKKHAQVSYHHGPQGLGQFANLAAASDDGYGMFPVFDKSLDVDPDDHLVPAGPPSEKKYPSAITLCLPLLSVTADVTVDGIIAVTELRQSYHNPSTINIPEARHTFPVYDGAVVSSFECTVGDVRFLKGVVKAREQARQEFEKARREKRETAGVLEEVTPEILEISLGNIPAKTTVEVKLTYVHELKVVTMEEEKSEGLDITIPLSIAPRYGTPAAKAPAPELPANRLDIWIRVLDDGSINPDGCRVESEHEASYEGCESARKQVTTSLAELASLAEPSAAKPQMQFVWHYASGSAMLKKDFVLVLQKRQGDRLRSRAVLAPANGNGHAALMVHLRPNDIFNNAVQPRNFTGEILFLLDRSGSMGWTNDGDGTLKIETMRAAMALALSGLPRTCVFNIISFGSEVRGLWHESQSAGDADKVKDARAHIPYINSDMGGTEVLLALESALKHRMESRPSTQMILITDGEVGSELNDEIISFVWKTRRDLGHKVRFFTLGIGDSVSHLMVEGIARLGGGYCDVVDVVKRPRWEGRFNRLLRSAMEPDSWTFDVDLGPGYERRSLLDFKLGGGQLKDTSAIPVIQAPFPIPPLHPYNYESVFFLIDGNGKPPEKVFLRTTTEGAKKKSYALDVETVASNGGAMHHLAAKAILLGLDHETKIQGSETNLARVNAESLGTRYSVASKWTSFVAVADDREAHEVDLYKSPFQQIDLQELLSLDDDDSDVYSSSGSDGYDQMSAPMPNSMPGQTILRMPNSMPDAMPSRLTPLPPTLPPPGRKWGPVKDTVWKRHRTSDAARPAVSEMDSPLRESRRQDWSYEPSSSPLSEKKKSSSSDDSLDDRPLRQMEFPVSPPPVWDDGRFNMPSGCNMPRQRMSLDIVDAQGTAMETESVSESEESGELEAYHPSADGPITCQDAVWSQTTDGFALADVIRTKLHGEFCNETDASLRKLLLELSPSVELTDVLVDTIMMMAYFQTHLAAEEDAWCLMMDNAERAVLLSLGFEEDQEDKLTGIYEVLRQAVAHTHFVQALKTSSTERTTQEDTTLEANIKSCPICNYSFDFVKRGFVCGHDACFDGARVVWRTWDEFWDHQVDNGHLNCPETVTEDNVVEM